jgi:hypothetical protein
VNHPIATYFSGILRHYRLQRLHDRLRHGLLFILIINLSYMLLLIPAEAIWYLSPDIKTRCIRLLFLNVIALIPLILYLWQAFRRHGKNEDEALLLHIGYRQDDVRDKLLNHYQLAKQNNALAAYAVQQFLEVFPQERFLNAYTFKRLHKKCRVSLLLLTALILEGVFLSPAAARLMHYGKSFEPPQSYSIAIHPKDTCIYAYDSLKINIVKQAPVHFGLEVYRREDGNVYREEAEHVRDSLFILDLPRLQESREYLVLLRRPHLFHPRKYPARDSLRIRVVRRPQIRTLDFYVRSPEYADIPDAADQGNVERIRCLPGSELRIEAMLTDSAGASYMLLNNDTLAMQSRGYGSNVNVVVKKGGRMTLMYYNKAGTGIREPLVYRLEIEQDLPPEIHVLRPEPGDVLMLNEHLRLPYMVTLRDDYGISDFRIRYQIRSQYAEGSGDRFETVTLPFEKNSRLQTLVGNWEIPGFVSPGSELHYYFEAVDNDTVNGPKLQRSRLYFARYPTLGDLYERRDEQEQRIREGMEEELLNTARIADDIEKVRQEILREGEMDWQKKTALEEDLNALEKSREALQELQEAIEEEQRFMEENALFEDDVLERFGQLRDLMQELIDDELWEMLRDIQEKMERNEKAGMEEILENFSEKARQFEESLDRMLEIFKRIQQEQRLSELGERMKESLRSQEQLLDKMDEMQEDDVATQEEKNAGEVETWEKRSHQSSDLFEGEDKESFEEFLSEMDSLSVSESMMEAMRQFRRSRRDEGRQNAEAAKESLKKLSQNFDQMSAAMMQRQREDVRRSFQSLLQKSIYMSARQEEALQFSEGIDNGSPYLHRYTSRQGEILALARDIGQQLMALSKKTFLVDKALGAANGQVIGNLQSGIRLIEEADISGGRRHITTAFAAMNRLSRLLLERNEMANQQQGNASGMEFYLQQLQQMAGQQESLNSGMPEPGMDGSPGDGLMDQLAQMATKQQALRRALKQIQQGMADGDGGRRLTGDLEKIAADMEEVIDQMRKNQVDRRTIMRQQQIVQRLLDASRSATSRDFKKERESRTGTDIERESPLGLPPGLGEGEDIFEALRNAVRESPLTPGEKREMERYLELLMEEYSGSVPGEEEE